MRAPVAIVRGESFPRSSSNELVHFYKLAKLAVLAKHVPRRSAAPVRRGFGCVQLSGGVSPGDMPTNLMTGKGACGQGPAATARQFSREFFVRLPD